MKQFNFTIQDTLGMHPRPAGKITSSAKGFTSDITLSIGDKVVNAKKLMNVISLNGKCGETIHAVVAGPDEAAAADALLAVLNAELGNPAGIIRQKTGLTPCFLLSVPEYCLSLPSS